MTRRTDAIRSLSRSIFGGAQYRLEVMAELRSGRPFSAVDLSVLIVDAPPGKSIHTELKCLRAARLISEVERPSSDRSKSFVPVVCSLWDASRDLVSMAEAAAEREQAIAEVLRDAADNRPQLRTLLESPAIQFPLSPFTQPDNTNNTWR